MPFIVVNTSNEKAPILLGRNWLERIKLDWHSIFAVDHNDPNPVIADIKSKYREVFEPGTGIIKSKQISLHVKEEAVPKFCKSRPVPFALKPLVDVELDRLLNDKIIRKVKTSEWATLLVVVRKPNGSVRLCADYKITLNPVLEVEHYPLPTTEELFSELAEAKVFTVLDLSHAYLQLPVKEESQKLLTINTHKGLFAYTRLPYGIKSAPFAFQQAMDEILEGINNAMCYLDDVLLVSKSKEEAIKLLDRVLKRFKEKGVKVNFEKCKFLSSQVKYLGYEISESGISPTEKLLVAIKNAPEPRDVDQLRSYVGLLNFYGKFLPNISGRMSKLYDLLKNVPWAWSDEHKKLFEESKNWLTSKSLLIHYDSTKPLTLTCDASATGIAAVISHTTESGQERPIAYASKTLSDAEKKYSQVEKEALAIIFGVKKFHKYLFGRKFVLYTDHKSLTTIFGEKKGIPAVTTARLQRWAIVLSAYDYKISHKKGSDIANADALSRLPISVDKVDSSNDWLGTDYFQNCLAFCEYDTAENPLTASDIARESKKDLNLQKVWQYTMHGWPNKVPDSQTSFKTRQNEITTENGCLMWGTRVIIPASLKRKILNLLHEGHNGITRTKMLARSYVWWPKIDEDIENHIKSCLICQSCQNSAPKVPYSPWPISKHPWQRIHIDFAKDTSEQLLRTSEGHYLLCIVDTYSKWIEVFLMKTMTAQLTVNKLRTLFAAYGLPEVLVSDNGGTFLAEEFQDFLKKNRVIHKLIPPYHACSNGAAEKTVQTVKKALLKQVLEDCENKKYRNVQHKIDNFLFNYRNTPNATSGVSPAEMFLKRTPRNKLTFLIPSFADKLANKQSTSKSFEDRKRGPERYFGVGEKVLVKSIRNDKIKWFSGVILQVLSPVTYTVAVGDERRRCHTDHLRKWVGPHPTLSARTDSSSRIQPSVNLERQTSRTESSTDQSPSLPLPVVSESSPQAGTVPAPSPKKVESEATIPCLPASSSPTSSSPMPEPGPMSPPAAEIPPLRRSTRVRRPPDRFTCS